MDSAPGPAPSHAGPVPPWPSPHNGATAALITGLLGLGFIPGLGIVAWVLGNSALKEIDANPWAWTNRDHAVAGRILGIVGTAIIALVVLAFVGFWLLGLIATLVMVGSTT